MVNQKRLSSSISETVKSLSNDGNIEQRLATYLKQHVDKTFEDIQKCTKEIIDYLIIVEAPYNYITAITKIDTLIEALEGIIGDYIKKHSTKNTNKSSKKTKKPTRKTAGRVIQKNSNRKKNKLMKTKPLTNKMVTAQTENIDSKLELDAMDKDKFEISVLKPNIENDQNVRRSQRVKYPPIDRWAGEKLMHFHDGSYALIKSKTLVKPELLLANKKVLAQLKKNKSRQKRLQTKKTNISTISKTRQVSKNVKKPKTIHDNNSSLNRRRTLYSPTRWLDSLNSNSDLYINDSTNSEK